MFVPMVRCSRREQERKMSSEHTVAGGRAPSSKNSLSRQDFLKLGGVGIAGLALLGAPGCGGGEAGSGKVVFSFFPDGSGGIQHLIDKFNEQNKGRFQVSHQAINLDTREYFDRLKTEFQAGGGETDVIGGDVPWTAEFAENGWIADVSSRFSEGERGEFLNGQIQSLTYQSKIWGKPWFAEAGLLYYRKDLLEQSGFSEPPQTWEELKEMAKKVVQDSGTRYGYLFQGANNETGVCNGLEYIWTHGGEVLDGDKVIIDSPESVAGLTTEQSMISEGVAPQAVANYTFSGSDIAFLNGDSVFCRNWSYMYGLAGNPEMSKIKREQVGVSPLPVGEGQSQRASCLGGWNMLISTSSEMQDEAWEFVRFMTSEENQKEYSITASTLPTLKTLYDDREILEEVPVVDLSKEALQNARPRPVSPYYSQMSPEMAEQFNNVIRSDVSPGTAIKSLQSDLQRIIQQG
jgi:multiple sugar transport system substrate-binding protein